MSIYVRVNIGRQILQLFDDQGLQREYVISTGKLGVGEKNGSFQTPRGQHLIRARIGDGMPENTVFVRRRPTGEYWSPQLHDQFPGRDWILTRILWLSGCEPGFNRLGDVDTMQRYIYIHGSPDITALGVPGSRGCIRMSNADVIDLFDRVPIHTPVEIAESD